MIIKITKSAKLWHFKQLKAYSTAMSLSWQNGTGKTQSNLNKTKGIAFEFSITYPRVDILLFIKSPLG